MCFGEGGGGGNIGFPFVQSFFEKMLIEIENPENQRKQQTINHKIKTYYNI